jgi:hypothetical protein
MSESNNRMKAFEDQLLLMEQEAERSRKFFRNLSDKVDRSSEALDKRTGKVQVTSISFRVDELCRSKDVKPKASSEIDVAKLLDKSSERLESMSVRLEDPRHGVGISEVSRVIPEEVVSVPEVAKQAPEVVEEKIKALEDHVLTHVRDSASEEAPIAPDKEQRELSTPVCQCVTGGEPQQCTREDFDPGGRDQCPVSECVNFEGQCIAQEQSSEPDMSSDSDIGTLPAGVRLADISHASGVSEAETPTRLEKAQIGPLSGAAKGRSGIG